MSKKHVHYSSESKAKVALAVISEDETVLNRPGSGGIFPIDPNNRRLFSLVI